MKLAQLGSVWLVAVAAVSASNAAVYEPMHSQRAAAPASWKDSVLYLADKFGIGDYYTIGHGSRAVEFIDSVHGLRSGKPQLLVVVKGVDEPATLFDGVHPNFEVALGKGKDATHLVKTLVGKFPKQVARAVNASGVDHLSDEIDVVTSQRQFHNLHAQFQLFNHELPQQWSKLVAAVGNNVPEQQVLGLQDLGLKLVNDKLYINELMQLLKLAAVENAVDEFAVANLDSLFSIGAKIGYHSRTYSVAKRALAKSILALQQGFDVTVVAIGPDHKLALEAAQLTKRSRELDSVFGLFTKRGAVAAKACFASEDACSSGTNACSGHGKCTKVQAKCWQCACAPTYDKKASKTTNWAGADCSKKDIAAQAHLLLWTSVALLATLAGGIKLLFSMGSDSLPGVLEAATVKRS